MINLGIYVSSLGDPKLTKELFKLAEDGINSGSLIDASIFYDQIAHIEQNPPCGLFNSTDVWNFKGYLFVTSIDLALRAVEIANHIKIFIAYGLGAKNTLATLHLAYNTDVEFISISNELEKDFFRITGKSSLGCCNGELKNIIKIITEKQND